MKIYSLLVFLVCFAFNTNAQNYRFYSAISRPVLENYLDRAISIAALSNCGTSLGTTPQEHIADIKMIRDIGAKFVGRIGIWWGANQDINCLMANAQQDVKSIKAIDSDIICEGGVFEYVDTYLDEAVAIPAYVFKAFDQRVVSRNFNHNLMLYDNPEYPTADEHSRTPDMSKLETQMWFYYMATRYIDAGCEALHLGDFGVMSIVEQNYGNKDWWFLLQKIRQYGSTRNRHIVLCNAHTFGAYYDPNPVSPLPNDKRQLLFDFHEYPSRLLMNMSLTCTAAYQPITLTPELGIAIYNSSAGGLNPQGWYCESNPYMVELDNGGSNPPLGCSASNSPWWVWGYDEISWFATQQPESTRANILKYIYYRIKYLDFAGHFEMPGRRNINNPNAGEYIAASGYGYNDDTVIQNIWNGTYANSANDNVIIYPNPAENLINIKLVNSQAGKLYYKIINLLGVVTSEGEMTNIVLTTINISNLVPGVYFIRIYDDERGIIANKKFLKNTAN